MLSHFIEVYNCPKILTEKFYDNPDMPINYEKNAAKIISKFTVRPMACERNPFEDKKAPYKSNYKEAETRPL